MTDAANDNRERQTFNTVRSIAVWSFVITTLAAAFCAAACFALYWTGKPVPPELSTATTAVVTYLFTKLPATVSDFQSLATRMLDE